MLLGLETNNFFNFGYIGFLSLLHVSENELGKNVKIIECQKVQDMLRNDSTMHKVKK